jgi:hypothetical protein
VAATTAVLSETCREGPFTFDVKGDVIEIFLKFETICPIVGLLKGVPEAYEKQYAIVKKHHPACCKPDRRGTKRNLQDRRTGDRKSG